MLRAIREIAPTWVVGENVYGIVNWNAGMVFEEVQADLEAEGYEVQPYILPAAAVNAPHQRYRVWFVAYSSGKRCDNRSDNRQERYLQDNINGDATEDQSERDGRECRISKAGEVRNAPNTDHKRLQGGKKQGGVKQGRPERNEFTAGCFRTAWEVFPTQSPVCSRDDGLSAELDGITFPKWRNESIKGYGNAIVPQVALQIFKAIEEYERI